MTYCNAMFETEEEKLRFVLEGEERFRTGVHAVAERILAARPGIVTLSGPTCSGKTTTANILIARLAEKGFRVRVISIDDFYRNRDELAEIARQKGVAYDWDSFASIDSAELKQFIDGILAGLNRKALVTHILQSYYLGSDLLPGELYPCNMLVFHVIRAINAAVHAVVGEIQRRKHDYPVAVECKLYFVCKLVHLLDLLGYLAGEQHRRLAVA